MLQAYESNYLLKQEVPTQVFFCEKTPILKNICKRLLLRVSYWNFATTQTKFCIEFLSICKLLKISLSTIRLRGEIFINFFPSDQFSKLQFSVPSFRFAAFVSYFVASFFTSCLSLRYVTYSIISKNRTVLLSINTAEVIDQNYQIMQMEQSSFSCKTVTVEVTVTVTETATVNIYVSHRNSGCCLFIIGEI